MEILSVIGSGLAVILILLTEFFSWRRRKREEIEAEKKEIALEQRVIDSVIERLRRMAKNENSLVDDVENRVDEELKNLGKNRPT